MIIFFKIKEPNDSLIIISVSMGAIQSIRIYGKNDLGKVEEIISQFRLVIFSCKEFTKSLHNGLWKDFLSFLQGKRATLMANYFFYFALDKEELAGEKTTLIL